jgi:hypothetical protein
LNEVASGRIAVRFNAFRSQEGDLGAGGRVDQHQSDGEQRRLQGEIPAGQRQELQLGWAGIEVEHLPYPGW